MGFSPLVTAVVAFNDSASATMTFHGFSNRASGDRGVPPVPGCRRNAIFRPSGDQSGNVSLDVDGAMKRIG